MVVFDLFSYLKKFIMLFFIYFILNIHLIMNYIILNQDKFIFISFNQINKMPLKFNLIYNFL